MVLRHGSILFGHAALDFDGGNSLLHCMSRDLVDFVAKVFLACRTKILRATAAFYARRCERGPPFRAKLTTDLRSGAEKRRSSREVQRSTFARFLGLFDFRLLQQNPSGSGLHPAAAVRRTPAGRTHAAKASTCRRAAAKAALIATCACSFRASSVPVWFTTMFSCGGTVNQMWT